MSAPLASLALASLLAGQLTDGAADQVAPPLRQAAACMLRVLETTRGVEAPRMGSRTDAAGVRPTVAYRYANPAGETRTVEFAGAILGGALVFSAGLPGIVPAGSAPDDWGTTKLGKLWKARCGVIAAVFYD